MGRGHAVDHEVAAVRRRTGPRGSTRLDRAALLAATPMAAINVLFRMHGKDAWIRVVG